MVIRQIKVNEWDRVYQYIVTQGRAIPGSLQYDVELVCNGNRYILKVQPEGRHRIAALQATELIPTGTTGLPDYILINSSALLYSFLEWIVYQSCRSPLNG